MSYTTVTGKASTGSAADEKIIWNYLMEKIGNAFGVAGLMGNLYAESGLRSNNLQNSYEKKLGYTDATYTEAVDNGTYTNFVRDSAGYGLVQWTYWSRKQAMLEYFTAKKKSIGDLTTQLEFLMKELSESYTGVLRDLKSATSILEASNSVLTKFERPADQSVAVQNKRASFGQKYFDKYAATEAEPTQPTQNGGGNKMSNSPLICYTKISPNRTSPRKDSIKKITIHHMAGNLSVEGCGSVFAPSSRQASSNYGIGTDGRIGMYVEEKDRAWTSSSPDNDNQAVTIEVANDEIGGQWHVSEKAMAALIDLCVDICKRNGIAKLNYTGNKNGNLTMHKWFAATACPGPYLESKFPYIAEQVNSRLGAGGTASGGNTAGTTTGTTTGSTNLTFDKGDIVQFTGSVHYTSANASNGHAVKPSRAKITAISKSGKHPYHCRAVNSAGSFIGGVYGWVDAADVKAESSAPVVSQPATPTTSTLGTGKPRTTEPSTTDKYWIHTSNGGLNECIEINNSGSCLPNCVGYAWGRFYEFTGKRPKLSKANAENWYGYTADGYQRSQTPAVGAVICWRKGQAGNGSDGAGHVAIVEEIKSNGDVVTSNSAYSGTRFYMKTVTKASGYSMGSAYTFQGFILPPGAVPSNAGNSTPAQTTKPTISTKIEKGDVVKIASGATYYNGRSVPSWVVNKEWIVEEVSGNRVVINKSVDGKNAINSPIDAKYLTVVGSAKEEWKPQIGDIIMYNGNVHYTSANASKGSACTGGKAKITNVYQLGKSKHPYHLVRVAGSGASVYGWVDADTFTKA